MSDVKAMLAKLGDVIGVQQLPPGEKAVEMTAKEFFDHAVAEVTKAKAETPEKAQKRLNHLRAVVAGLTKALAWESTEKFPVPMFEDKDQVKTTEENGKAPVTQPGTDPIASAKSATPAPAAKSETDKQIAAIKDILGELSPEGSPDPKKQEQANAEFGWPRDVNSTEFRKGEVRKSDRDDWGKDPWTSQS